MAEAADIQQKTAVGEPSAALLLTVAVAVGCLVANLYYAQPLVSQIGPDLKVSPEFAGSIVSITQVGYGLGLFFLVSLSDLIESRKLVLSTLTVTVLSLIGMAASKTVAPFFVAALLIGVCSTGAQVLIPLIAHLVPIERRGRAVGNVMSGLLTGIMLARPVSLFIAASFGWRAVFYASAVVMVLIGLALYRMLPEHKPKPGLHYGQILWSMLGILKETPAVRWRAIYQFMVFAAFNLFWTTAPLMLAERFHMSTQGIGLFALAGAGGALCAPLVGHLADRGHGRLISGIAMLSLAASFAGTTVSVATLALVPLVVLTIILDAAVQGNQIVSQRIIFSSPPERRGRVNAIYMTSIFAGGALGSVAGTILYHNGGWNAAAATGIALGVVPFLLFMVELATSKAPK
jgi:predicted MFS family arabinose efflux permease